MLNHVFDIRMGTKITIKQKLLHWTNWKLHSPCHGEHFVSNNAFRHCKPQGWYNAWWKTTFELLLSFFLWVFIDDFEVHNNRTSHLAKLELLFSCVNNFLKGKMINHIVSKNGMAWQIIYNLFMWCIKKGYKEHIKWKWTLSSHSFCWYVANFWPNA